MSDNDKQLFGDQRLPVKNDTGELETLHPDLILRRQLEKGEITQAEIDRVWKATSDLSPQTPITVRRAVLLMREVTKGKTPQEAMALNWPFFTQEVMRSCTEMQAALMRDESKFSHLVAGTETIVKELQKVETLNRQFDHINAQLETIASSLRVLLVRPKPHSLIRWQRRMKRMANQKRPAYDADDPRSGLERLRSEELIPDPDHAANEARRFSIGSAWAKETDKGPLYKWRCVAAGCTYVYESGKDPAIEDGYRCLYDGSKLLKCYP